MGAVMARWHPRCGAGGAGSGSAVEIAATRPRSGGAGEKTKLTAGAHLTERREGGSQLGRRGPKGKTYFRKYATDARASWASKDGFGPQEERGQRGRLGQWPSGPVRLAEPKAKKKNFLIKN
jgi:hypothetical protein